MRTDVLRAVEPRPGSVASVPAPRAPTGLPSTAPMNDFREVETQRGGRIDGASRVRAGPRGSARGCCPGRTPSRGRGSGGTAGCRRPSTRRGVPRRTRRPPQRGIPRRAVFSARGPRLRANITTTGTSESRTALTAAGSLRPVTSLSISAPRARARRITRAFRVSTETRTPPLQRRDHRLEAPDLLRGVDPRPVRIARLRPHLDDIRPFRDERAPLLDRRARVEVAPAVGERVRGDVQDADDDRQAQLTPHGTLRGGASLAPISSVSAGTPHLSL